MLNYNETITEFLIQNFTPSTPLDANLKLTTEQLLEFLFRTFPANCISDYDLNDILISLNYKRCTYVVESYTEYEKKGETIIEIKKTLQIGWCLKSEHDLHTEEV